MIWIARVTNSAGRSRKTSLPVRALMVVPYELSAERNSSEEPSAGRVSAPGHYGLGWEIRLWIRTPVSAKSFHYFFLPAWPTFKRIPATAKVARAPSHAQQVSVALLLVSHF